MKKDFTSKNNEVIRISPLRDSDNKKPLTENTSQNPNTPYPRNRRGGQGKPKHNPRNGLVFFLLFLIICVLWVLIANMDDVFILGLADFIPFSYPSYPWCVPNFVCAPVVSYSNPVVSYSNPEAHKKSIFKDNKGKSGVYQWVNKKNHKVYVGSSVNLYKRFQVYWNPNALDKSNMAIYKGLKKYGYSGFSLEILEYCDPKDVIKREQYYINLLKPKYNLLQVAGSSFGFKHSESWLAKLRNRKLSEEHRAKLRGVTRSEETKANIKAGILKRSEEAKANIKAKMSEANGTTVEVTNLETKDTIKYTSLREVAKALNSHHNTIGRYLKNQKVFKDKYQISLERANVVIGPHNTRTARPSIAPLSPGGSPAKSKFYHTSCCQSPNKISPYLAGLIEADGSIAVHDKKTKAKRYCPKIIVVFSLADKPLAERLAFITQAGKVYYKANAGYVLWQIQKKEDVIKIIKLINGYMRTPKIEALHRAITWFNQFDNCSIDCLGLDNSPICSNGWLAGFSDGDSNFSITLTDRKKKGKVPSKRVQTFFRIELRQNYHRGEAGADVSYFSILSKIAEYLNVNLYTRTRGVKDKVFYAFMVIAHSSKSHEIVKSYFDIFPLYSSKYLDYRDWCRTQDLTKEQKGLILEHIEEIRAIKAQFKNKRKVFNFTHLDSLTL
jgi:group I intron endonuclease